MAYQGDFHKQQVDYIMKIYEEWKERNSDRSDKYFVRVILREKGHFMSYQGFMNGYKARHKRKRKNVEKKQFTLFN